MRTIIIALAILLAASVATAQRREPMLSMGLGTATCGKFAEDYSSAKLAEAIYFTWAQGYMTARNNAEVFGQLEKGTDKTSVQFRDLNALSTQLEWARVRSYCNEHPLANYQEAVDILYASLPPATLKQ
jgi:hypothetical protein